MDLDSYLAVLDKTDPLQWTGTVTQLIGLLVESKGPAAAIGDFCEAVISDGRRIRTQVIGFRDGRLLSMPLEETDGLQLGDAIVARKEAARVEVGPGLLGRVLDGFGKPIDGKGAVAQVEDAYGLFQAAPGPLEREPITDRLVTGIRVIDSLLTIGKGQRVGIFGGSGVGKSTLLGAMSRQNSADVSVIALIGERNREVRDFLEHELSEAGLKRSVVIVATSDRPAPLRIRAGFVALAVSEYFRDKGADVLLVMDSVTRLAMAQREIGLAAGEPPSQKGYTPSVFNLLPRVFERAGRFRSGSITGFFTVLVEGDDFNEPVATNFTSFTIDQSTAVPVVDPGVLSLRPDPAVEELTLTWPVPYASPTTVDVIDVNGKVVFSEALVPGQGAITLRVGSLSDGLYTVRVRSAGQVRSGRFVKAH